MATPSATARFVFTDHKGGVLSVAFSPDSTLLATASSDKTVGLWNIPTGELSVKLTGHTSIVTSVAFSPDGESIVTGSEDMTVRTLSVRSRRELQTFQGHTSTVRSVAWSPKNDLIASGSEDRTVILWNVASGLRQNTLAGQKHDVTFVLFSQDGSKLVLASNDKAIIRNVASGATLMTLTHPIGVQCVCFSRDDQFILTAGGDKIIRMFDMAGRETKQFKGHTDWVMSLAFSFDNSMIMSASDDKTVRLWETSSGQQLQRLDRHTAVVRSVAFSRDGKYLASGGWDNTIFVWNAPSSLQTPNSLLKAACFEGNVDDARQQLEKGALVNSKDGAKALCAASRLGHHQVVELLMEWGADVNMRDEGQTALQHAIKSKQVAVVRLLLERGADTNGLDAANISKSEEINNLIEQATCLQGRGLTSIPIASLNQKGSFSLHLRNNKLDHLVWDSLGASLACTESLVGLFLQSNPLVDIPDTVVEFSQLSYLSVATCGLSSSSIRALSKLPNLRSLDLSENQLGDLPTEFSCFHDLRILNISSCKLSLVPAVVMQFEQLRDLNISNNPIHRLPVALAELRLLTRILLSGCPLTEIPNEFHSCPTAKLLKFLKDLAQKSRRVYRSKLLLVGYGGVGKTTLLGGLFPLSGDLQYKSKSFLDMLYVWQDPWQRRFCKIVNSCLISYRSTSSDTWEKDIDIKLAGAIISVNQADEVTWFIQPKGQTWQHEFRCNSALQRQEWVTACKFQSLNSATNGVSITLREITHDELKAAVNKGLTNPPRNAPADWERTNRVPKDATLQLTLCDFAGQHEYQDGHQLFLTSRSIYLVLWDVTPGKRIQELAKLRHWLVTLQLQLGSDQLRNNVLIYIVGTHADALGDDPPQHFAQVIKVTEDIQLSVPYRIMSAPIDTRNPQEISTLKQQLLVDLAVQPHLGELVPVSYLDLDHQLCVAQNHYRAQYAKDGSSAKVQVPLLQKSDLASQLKVDVDLVTNGLSLLHLWGQIVYLDDLCPEVIVYSPEWLTVDVLGSLVTELRKQLNRIRRAAASDDIAPVVRYLELVQYSPVWQSLSTQQGQQVMQMLYEFDLGFPLEEEGLSLFPLLLPLKPPPTFEWTPTRSTPELSRVIELNGIPMGFNTIMLSRLNNANFKIVKLSSCWQSGILIQQSSDPSCIILVTIHEHLSRIRICVRNSKDFAKVFHDVVGVLKKMFTERYKGVKIMNEFVECVCITCQKRHWHWNKEIAEKVEAHAQINGFATDAVSRADLSRTLLNHIHPDVGPHCFLVDTLLEAQQSLLCESNNVVSIADLTSPTVSKISEDVMARLHKVESKLSQYDLQLEIKIKELFAQCDPSQQNPTYSDLRLSNRQLWNYCQMFSEVLNSAYTGAYAIKSNNVSINLTGTAGNIVDVFESVGMIVGQIIPGFLAVTGLVSAIAGHFVENDQRQRLDRLILYTNPTDMFKFVAKLARHLAFAQQAKIESTVVSLPQSDFFKTVKETLFYERINAAKSTEEQHAQRLAIIHAKAVIEFITNHNTQLDMSFGDDAACDVLAIVVQNLQ